MSLDIVTLQNPPTGWSLYAHTLAHELEVIGKGLHTGKKACLRILPFHPIDDNSGIIFRRVNKAGKVLAEARVSSANWQEHPFCSSLKLGNNLYVRTVEHLLASLLMCEIDNAIIELDAEEVPILDSSAAEWIKRIKACGSVKTTVPKKFLKIVKDVKFEFKKAKYHFKPASDYLLHSVTHEHDFKRMEWRSALTPELFAKELSQARSFGHLRRIIPALMAGLFLRQPILRGALNSSAAMIFNKRVLGGMIFPDEFVRHRALDFIGDFAFLGAPILGEIFAHKTSHKWNHICLERLLATKDAWVWAKVI